MSTRLRLVTGHAKQGASSSGVKKKENNYEERNLRDRKRRRLKKELGVHIWTMSRIIEYLRDHGATVKEKFSDERVRCALSQLSALWL